MSELFIDFILTSRQSHNLQTFFPHCIDCLLVLLMVSFSVQKILSLVQSHLFIFAFTSYDLRYRSKNYSTIYVKECSVNIHIKEFCGFWNFSLVFSPF